MLDVHYAKGRMSVFSVPENHSDLYHLPQQILDYLRRMWLSEHTVRLEAPAKVALFLYDNDTFIVASFLPHSTVVKAVVNRKQATLVNLEADSHFHSTFTGHTRDNDTHFELTLHAGTFLALKIVYPI